MRRIKQKIKKYRVEIVSPAGESIFRNPQGNVHYGSKYDGSYAIRQCAIVEASNAAEAKRLVLSKKRNPYYFRLFKLKARVQK